MPTVGVARASESILQVLIGSFIQEDKVVVVPTQSKDENAELNGL